MIEKQKLQPFTESEVQAAKDFFTGPNEIVLLNMFVGWMASAGRYSGTVADEIRGFVEHINRQKS